MRFMDDVFGARVTRVKLRGAVRTVNAVLASLHLEKHPDKTFIGPIAKGFDYLGYRFGAGALELAEATIANFVEQASRLYEQGRRERCKALLLGRYVRRWLGWADGGLMAARLNGVAPTANIPPPLDLTVGMAAAPCRPVDAR